MKNDNVEDYSKYELYQDENNDKIWWIDNYDRIGEYVFTFDKKRFFNFFADCPQELTASEWKIFKKEEPTLASLKASVTEKPKLDERRTE